MKVIQETNGRQYVQRLDTDNLVKAWNTYCELNHYEPIEIEGDKWTTVNGLGHFVEVDEYHIEKAVLADYINENPWQFGIIFSEEEEDLDN